jgi:hypothetical protein
MQCHKDQQDSVMSSSDLGPKKDCTGEVQQQLDNCKLQTLSLVREGAPHQQTCNCLKIILKKKKNWLQVPDGQLTVSRSIILTVPRGITGHRLQGDISMGSWPLKLGDSQIRDSKIWS